MMESDSENGLEELLPAWICDRPWPVGKPEVHRSGLSHEAVSVFANRGDLKHALGLRSKDYCTHPRWSEAAAETDYRRGRKELRPVAALCPCGRVDYHADVGVGLVAREELAMFLTGHPNTDLPPHDPAEVAATRWLSYPDLEAAIAAEPEKISP